MIKANVILDYSKWKNKIKDPNNYLKKKLSKLNKILHLKKKQEFSILLTNNKKMRKLRLKKIFYLKKKKSKLTLLYRRKFLKIEELQLKELVLEV